MQCAELPWYEAVELMLFQMPHRPCDRRRYKESCHWKKVLGKGTGVFVREEGGRVARWLYRHLRLHFSRLSPHPSAVGADDRSKSKEVCGSILTLSRGTMIIIVNSTTGWQFSRFHSPNLITRCSLLLMQESYIMLETLLQFVIDSVVLL